MRKYFKPKSVGGTADRETQLLTQRFRDKELHRGYVHETKMDSIEVEVD